MIPYMGGKSRLAKWIIGNFPKDHTNMSYVEVFGGGGWVLHKKERSKLETYNDINGDLVNLFTVIRDNFKEYGRKAKWTFQSRETHKKSIGELENSKGLDNIQRALYYSVSIIQSFSRVYGAGWNASNTMRRNSPWSVFVRNLICIRDRLSTVQLENLHFADLIKRYDSANTLFYLDPPYIGTEHFYHAYKFTEGDHRNLAEILKNIKGKFVLSYYEHSLATELYPEPDFNFKCKEMPKSSQKRTNGGKRDKGTEILIMNYRKS